MAGNIRSSLTVPGGRLTFLASPILAVYLLHIRPTTWGDAWPYYSAVAGSIIGRVFGREVPVSDFIHRPITVRREGLVFSVRPGTPDLAMVAMSVDPPEVRRSFRPRPGSTIVDVGANIGGYAVGFATAAERVLAIEPEPSNFQQLVAHIQMNGLTNVVPLRVAVSDRRGTAVLHLTADSGRHSLESVSWGVATGETINVETVPLDDIIEHERLDHIDWLKIDVERHELPVLRGASKSLDITRNLVLEFELTKLDEVSLILQNHGLKIVWYDRRSENSALIAASESRPGVVSNQPVVSTQR